MQGIQLATKNTISFKRIDTKYCIGYEIYARCYTGSNSVEFLLDTINNPKTVVPFRRAKFLEYNSQRMWELEEKALAKTSSDISVYVNNVRLNTSQYTYSSPLGVLNIHSPINIDDSIKIEYNVDRIKYIHNTNAKHSYRVVPIFKGEYRLGEHSSLDCR